MFRFTIRDVLWLTVVVALAVGWWTSYSRMGTKSRRLETMLREEVLLRRDAEYRYGILQTARDKQDMENHRRWVKDNFGPVQDLRLLQGRWELLHGDGAGKPSIRSVKEIEGNRATLRRYDVMSGKLECEHTEEFTLARTGEVCVFTSYPVGGDPNEGQSFVYKVDGESFYDVPGLLQGVTCRNYLKSPTVWHWKKVKAEIAPATEKPKLPSS